MQRKSCFSLHFRAKVTSTKSKLRTILVSGLFYFPDVRLVHGVLVVDLVAVAAAHLHRLAVVAVGAGVEQVGAVAQLYHAHGGLHVFSLVHNPFIFFDGSLTLKIIRKLSKKLTKHFWPKAL